VTVISVLGTLLFCALAAYSLAKFKYRGNSLFFILILSTIMVPTEMLIIPWFSGIHQLKLGNTYPGLIFPGLISAFGVFILRQAILNIPDEYIEAARIDGMSEPGIFFRIILPLISGPLTALALITALNVWNDFLWPLIVVNNKAMYTIQVGIAYAADATATDLGTDWSIVMSATTIASVPMLLLVIAAQKYFVKGISLSGLKR
jgi:multiple sugar transport system permease protein